MIGNRSILHTAAGLAVAALLAQALAGCSAGTRALPGGIAPPQSRDAGNPYNARAVAIPNASKFLAEAERRGVPHKTIRNAATKCKKNAYIYTSETVTADLDVFCEDTAKKGTPNGLISQTPGLAGWGLAVSPDKLPVPTTTCGLPAFQELLAVGTNSGTINIYCKLSGGGYTQLNPSTSPLTLTQGDAYGICFDQTGGIYATEFPYNTIAHFTNAQLATGGTPTILTTNVNVAQYYVACDYDKLMLKGKPKGENYLMAYGFDANGNVNVTNVNTSTGAETVEQTIGNVNSGTGFPGGLALDRRDDLVVNNQYGTLYYFNPELWNSKPLGTCTWGYNPNDYTNIVFDDRQDEIWAADTNFSASGLFTTYGQSNAFPFKGSGACSPGSSGYQTSHPLAGESQYLGIAVWPNRGV
jgi:hypothetical protein